MMSEDHYQGSFTFISEPGYVLLHHEGPHHLHYCHLAVANNLNFDDVPLSHCCVDVSKKTVPSNELFISADSVRKSNEWLQIHLKAKTSI